MRKAAAPKPKPAAWIPSPDGVVKVNVDAAAAHNKDHGVAAAVARTAAGQYLGSSAVLITGISDPEVLEAIAVREGQNLALDIAAYKIKVASDCLSVVKAWKEKNLGRLKCGQCPNSSSWYQPLFDHNRCRIPSLPYPSRRPHPFPSRWPPPPTTTLEVHLDAYLWAHATAIQSIRSLMLVILDLKTPVFPKWRTFFTIVITMYALEDHLTTD
ncbi:hypothetical protein QYE76_067875 [Lolium multiflorum]|uniref:RNase H type-1 domain-containing protein n=1 Tax=Lolium multiflorum TaxID=4521 RepID=A0AAD8SFP0_LOLMU|nr:hypothetical protein QYE76_067875 [Lolium multiflorum]